MTGLADVDAGPASDLVWRGEVLEVRVWGGRRWYKRMVTWRGSVDETERVGRVVLARLVEHVEAMLAAPRPPASSRRTPPRRPTFDAAPLLRQARLTVDRYEGVTPNDPGAASWAAVTELLGTSYRQVVRWLAGSRLQEETADRMAVALGLHPVLLWPEWYEVTAA